MQVVSDAAAAAAAGSADPVFRVTILDEALDGPVEVQVDESGQVRVDGRSVIERTATLTVENSDGTYNPDPDGLLWWSRPWRVDYGFMIDGVAEYVPLITGYPDEPSIDLETGKLTIPFRDRLKLIAESKHQTPETYAGAMRVADFVRAECVAGGIPDVDTNFDLDDAGSTMGLDHTYEQGTGRLDAMAQVAADNALRLRASPRGVITLSPIPDPNTADIVASYQRGPTFTGTPLLGGRKTWTPLIKNRAVVVGEDRFGDPVRAEVADTNEDSPYSVSRIGDQPDDPYVSLGITTLEQALRVATARLPTLALIVESLELSVPLNPAHEYGDIIEVTDADSGTEGRYLLDSFPVGLSVSAAGALSVRKVRALS